MATLLAAASVAVIPARASAADGLTVSGVVVYTVDPAGRSVHVRAELDFVNQDESTRGRMGCYGSVYFSVPTSARGFVNQHVFFTGKRRRANYVSTWLTPLEGVNEAVTLHAEVYPCVRYGESSHHMVIWFDLVGLPTVEGVPGGFDPAYFGFTIYEIAPAGVTYQLVVPEGYAVDTLGPKWSTQQVGTDTMYILGAGDAPRGFEVYAAVRNDSLLTNEEVAAGARPFRIGSWTIDVEWSQLVRDMLERGVPALEAMVGESFPTDGWDLLRESYSAYVFDAENWTANGDQPLEVRHTTEPTVVLHELAHAWFNSGRVQQRWLAEGLAHYAADGAARSLGLESEALAAVDTESPAAMVLNEWGAPDPLSDATTAKEAFGQAAARLVVQSIADEIGPQAMGQVIAATLSGADLYGRDPGAVTTDWRRFLDAAEFIGGSTTASELFRRYVVSDADLHVLDRRERMVEAYRALELHGGEWGVPASIRTAMAEWDFAHARALIEDAEAALAARDEVSALATDAGMQVDTAASDAYREGEDLSSTADTLSSAADAVRLLSEAERARSRADGFLASVGLLGGDVDGTLAAARSALLRGDLDAAVDHSKEVMSSAQAADSDGENRLILAVIVVLALGAGVVLSRRRRKRGGVGPAPLPLEVAQSGVIP